MSLDKKLEDISTRVAIHGIRPGASSALDPKDAPEAIKQAFIDEGWVQLKLAEVKQFARKATQKEIRELTGSPMSLVTAYQQDRMTGPEWLARFEKELKEQKMLYRTYDESQQYVYTACVNAARRAAGVDE